MAAFPIMRRYMRRLFPRSTESKAPSIYRPLSTERPEIRLLTLYPGVGNQTIEGSLHHVFLDDIEEPRYETVSCLLMTLAEDKLSFLSRKHTLDSVPILDRYPTAGAMHR